MKLLLITDTGEQIEARCDGCRHWGKPAWPMYVELEDDTVEETERMACARIKWAGSSRGLDEGDPMRVAPALVVDVDQSGAELQTRAEWFCPLFERKETA
jgi:hypothetical protein